MNGNDTVHYGIKNRLNQRGAVTQFLLNCIFIADIAEYQHSADDKIFTAANRRATVGDIVLTSVSGNQYGVVGQALDRTVFYGTNHRDGSRLAGIFINDVENFVYRNADSGIL